VASVQQVDLRAVSVIAELDRMGWAWEPAGGDGAWIKTRCPSHDDQNPSCGVNLEGRYFKCNVPACAAGGDFVTFMSLALKQPRGVIFADLQTRYPIEANKVIDAEAVERWHQAIWDCAPMLAELRKRGVSDHSIRKYRLGFNGKRVTIPVTNPHGQYVNVRKYLPGAPGPEKMRNLRGHGEIRLFPVDQLKYDTVIVVGGEVKAIVTAEKMNPLGMGAICATAGEGNWEPHLTREFRGKRAYVSFDVDAEGRRAQDLVCARLSGEARWVGGVDLSQLLDVDKYPHGDQNDLFATEGRTAETYAELLEKTPRWEPRKTEEPEAPGTALELPLAEVTHSKHAGKRVELRAVVQAKAQEPYLVPSVVECICSRDQKFCSECPVFGDNVPEGRAGVPKSLRADSPAVLQMVGSGSKTQHTALMRGLKIPPCKSVSFKTLEHYSVEDLRLRPPLALTATGPSDVEREALYVGHGIGTNQLYRMTGRVHPHPDDQRAVFVASEATAAEDSLDTFKPTEEELEQLRLFQPREWTVEGIQEKLDDLYSDLETNVTRIFYRRDLHLAVDLSYHSPLVLQLDGREVKGWTEVLVVGDSGQGKTETAQQLQRHYALGCWTPCRDTSKSGLLGGLQALGNRWFITWGALPLNDRRHVTLEEMKGVPVEVIATLTDARSSGVAHVQKVKAQSTHSRTRLLGLSNPRSSKTMERHSFGIEAVLELVGSPEDVRRFDMALVVDKRQVDQRQINRMEQDRPRVDHRHLSELCSRLILWAWTRTPSQVHFPEETVKSVMAGSVAMCDKFTDAIPLVDRGDMRNKLARLAASLACRTYSRANRDAQSISVRPCHVEYVVQYLDRVYSSQAFGYADYSRAVRAQEGLTDEKAVREKVLQAPFLLEFIESVLVTQDIEMRDLQDWCGWEYDQARELLSFLVRKRALVRDRNAYRKTPHFIELLKQMRDDPATKESARPDWLKDVDTKKREF
jgi:hypothetical protein